MVSPKIVIISALFLVSVLTTPSRPQSPENDHLNGGKLIIQKSNTQNLPLLTRQQLKKLNRDADRMGQSWIDLAGLDKVSHPPAFPTSLQTFRKTWSAKKTNAAPFLGVWQDSGDVYGTLYSIAIFPAAKLHRVCVLEFHPGYDAGLADLRIQPTLVFSTAQVKNRQLIGSRLRSAQSAISRKSWNANSVEMMGILNRQNQIQLLAAVAPPSILFTEATKIAGRDAVFQRLYGELPATELQAVLTALAKEGCR
jgi:hypothetical protein